MRPDPVTLSKTYAHHDQTFDRLEFRAINYPTFKRLGEPGGYSRTDAGVLMAHPDDGLMLEYAEALVENVPSSALNIIDDLGDIRAIVRAVRAPFVAERRRLRASDDGDATASTASDGIPDGSTPNPSPN